MAFNVRSAYPGRTSTTEVDPLGGQPGLGNVGDQLAGLMGQEQSAAKRRPVVGTATRGSAPRPTRQAVRGRSAPRPDGLQRLARAQAAEEMASPWYTRQSAAMRPVGLGPGMIPGMGIDPRFLPPEMRPQESSFQGPIVDPVSAGDDLAESLLRDRMVAPGHGLDMGATSDDARQRRSNAGYGRF